jgi:hypothetical protein
MADFVDFLPNAWRYAMADAGLLALVTPNTSTVNKLTPIGKDPDATPNNAYESGWIFRDINDQRPPRSVKNTGWASVLLSQYDHWSNQVRHHTTKFPILTVFIFADVTRDGSGSPIAQDAEEKVRRVWKEIDRLFHDAANRIHAFDTLRIVSSVESSPLSILDVPDGDGAVRGTVRYDITL